MKPINKFHSIFFITLIIFFTGLYFLFTHIGRPLQLDESSNFSNLLIWKEISYILPGYYLFILPFVLFFRHIELIRLYMLIITCVQYWVLFLLLREVHPQSKKSDFLLLIGMVILTPVLLQGSIFFDENIFLNTGLTLYLLMIFKLRRQSGGYRIVVLSALLSLILMIKLTTVLIIPVFLIILYILNRLYGRQDHIDYRLSDIIIHLLLSIIGFTFIYALTMPLFDYPWIEPFSYVFNRSESLSLSTLIAHAAILLLWISPFFPLCFIPVVIQDIKSRDILRLGIFILIALVTAGYLKSHFMAGSYPKYLIWPIQLSLVYLYPQIIKILTNLKRRDFLFITLTIVYYFFVLRDPLLFSFPLTGSSFMIDTNRTLFLYQLIRRYIIILLPVVPGFIIYRKFSPVVILLYLIYGFSLSTHQVFAPYATVYAYGERGLLNLMQWSRIHVKPTDNVYGIKDLATLFYPYGKKVSAYFEYTPDITSHKAVLNQLHPDYVILRNYWILPYQQADFNDIMTHKGYIQYRNFNDFTVYILQKKVLSPSKFTNN